MNFGPPVYHQNTSYHRRLFLCVCEYGVTIEVNTFYQYSFYISTELLITKIESPQVYFSFIKIILNKPLVNMSWAFSKSPGLEQFTILWSFLVSYLNRS